MSMLRLSAVTIPEMRAIVFVANFTPESLPASIDWSHWMIDDDVRLVLPDDSDTWPGDPDDPGPAILCRSMTDPKGYAVFGRSGDVREAEFVPTGMTYGGVYSEAHWGRFVGNFPRILRFLRVSDADALDVETQVLETSRQAH